MHGILVKLQVIAAPQRTAAVDTKKPLTDGYRGSGLMRRETC